MKTVVIKAAMNLNEKRKEEKRRKETKADKNQS